MAMNRKSDEKINWISTSAFWIVHLSCLAAFWTGFSWTAVIVLLLTYSVRMFGITAGYHRYFSHRSFKTGRIFQFILGAFGAASAQKGPLWWAALHRHHHKYSDTEKDIHSPARRGFWWSHVGWILCDKYNKTDYDLVHDLAKYPELKFLNRFHLIPPILLAATLFGSGYVINLFFPSLHTSGLQLLIWGFFISTVMVYHGTFSVNSLAHVLGRKRFNTKDDSKNSLLIALYTFGEGWHNNHHRYPSSERQGFYWWEIDFSHYMLKILSWFHIVWDLRTPPQKVYAEKRYLKRPVKF